MYVCSECGQRSERAGYCAAEGYPLSETDDPLLGTEIGRYRLAALIGEGGMGRVYRAVQPMIGSRVAIKVLADQCARNPELLDRFFAEARAVNLIRHENIVSVIDMARLDDGRPYIVMEFVAGHTLTQLVRGGPAPLGGVVQVMGEVLSALAAAHAIGIVHRDLKPDNVLVTVEGHAKVLDFGIAKLAPSLGQNLSPRTRTGALLGTPAYMAPEQISGGGRVDPRTDVYAAGIVLFEAVTGRLPFQGETLFDLMREHLEQAPPLPSLLRADLPEPIEHVILTALAKPPEQRFQTAGAMGQALQHAAAWLPADQWRALSSRGGMIPGGGQSLASLRDAPTRDMTPVGLGAQAELARGDAAEATRKLRRSEPPLRAGSEQADSGAGPAPHAPRPATRPATGRRTRMFAGAVAAVAILGGVTAFAVLGADGAGDGPVSATTKLQAAEGEVAAPQPQPGAAGGVPQPGTAGGVPQPGTAGGVPQPGTAGGVPQPGTAGGVPEPGTAGGVPVPGTAGGVPQPATGSGPRQRPADADGGPRTRTAARGSGPRTRTAARGSGPRTREAAPLLPSPPPPPIPSRSAPTSSAAPTSTSAATSARPAPPHRRASGSPARSTTTPSGSTPSSTRRRRSRSRARSSPTPGSPSSRSTTCSPTATPT